MPSETPEEELRRLATRRVERRAFYVHFTLWAIVNLVLVGIWKGTGGGFPWFLFPLGIWGAFLLLHFLVIWIFAARRAARPLLSAAAEAEAKRLKEEERLKEARRLKKEKEKR